MHGSSQMGKDVTSFLKIEIFVFRLLFLKHIYLSTQFMVYDLKMHFISCHQIGFEIHQSSVWPIADVV